MKQKLLIGGIAVLAILLIVQTFQISSLKEKTGSTSGGNIQGGIDFSGWTEDEKMQYEHHGVLPARLQGNSQPAQGSGMVGAC